MKKLFFIILFFILISGTEAQTRALTKEQIEFVELIKAILSDKEIDSYLEKNNFFWNAEGKTIYILNENTPFYQDIEMGKPLPGYKEYYKKRTQLNICFLDEIFFVGPEKYISVRENNIGDKSANITLDFNTYNNKTIMTKKLNLAKRNKWKLAK